MLGRTLRGACFVLVLLLMPVFSYAAEQNITCSTDDWNPISAGPVTTWTASLCGQGRFVVQPFFFYNHTRGFFDSGGHYSSLPSGDRKSQYQEQIFFQYGITDRLEVDGQAVYQQNYEKESGANSHSSGWGDSYLYTRLCALEEQAVLPQVTLLSQLKFPTGRYQASESGELGTDSMGTGSFDHGYGFILTKKIKPFVLHADFTYSFPCETKIDGIKTDYADYITYDASVEYFLPKGFNLMLEFNWFKQGDRKEESERIPGTALNYLVMAPGIGWSNETIQMLLAYQRTLSGTNTDANDSVVFTFVYTF